jgi:hypothetical protein
MYFVCTTNALQVINNGIRCYAANFRNTTLAGSGNTRFCFGLWVAQRFTAAKKGFFSVPALAAEGDYRAPNEFFSKLFRR